jgi:hypothetical protein
VQQRHRRSAAHAAKEDRVPGVAELQLAAFTGVPPVI